MLDKHQLHRRVDGYTAPVSQRTFSPPDRPARHRPFTDYALFAVLVGPNVGLLLLFVYRPLADNIRLSFFDWNISDPTAHFVGVSNYVEWFTRSDTWQIVLNTAMFTGAAVIGSMVLGLVLAMLLDRPLRGRNLFALRNAGMSRADTRQRVLEVANMLELTELLDRKPSKLSGGQRQRVAMGRAIVRRPLVFCMDEPLSNLDAKLRVSTRSQISGLQRRLGTTTVYVTHDQVEAMTMGDRVAVLKDGVLQQVDSPRALYDNPVNTFVATFIGAPAMNLIDASVADGAVTLHDLSIPVPSRAVAQNRVVIGVRPESWDVASADTPGLLTVQVELVEELGFESFVYATPAQQEEWSLRAQRIVFRTDRRTAVRVGESLSIVPHPREVRFFDSQTEARIR
jgi:sn-glycerol 3-phosphate transport system ATP-binding protein